MLSIFNKNHKKLYITILVSLLVDIISKQIIINKLLEKQSIPIIKNIFNLTYTKNKGVAFSFFYGNKLFIIISTIIILIVLTKYVSKIYLNKYEQIGYGLIIGGAIGNLIDRLVYGYVIDFIDFTIINYPIFNLADTAIVIGVIIIIITSFKRKK